MIWWKGQNVWSLPDLKTMIDTIWKQAETMKMKEEEQERKDICDEAQAVKTEHMRRICYHMRWAACIAQEMIDDQLKEDSKNASEW